jgi:glycosyltransferase involved in cell wall biosynthesis
VLERPNTHTRYAFDVLAKECTKLGFKLPKRHSHAFDPYRLNREEEEFQLTDGIFCLSEFVMKTFLDAGFQKKKLLLHQRGFDPSRFRFSRDTAVGDYEQLFTMAFVGRCEPRKGLHYALDAWLGFKASHSGIFYICGKYVQGYRKLLASRLARPRIKEICFLEDVGSLLRKCHVLIHPSIEEGSALVTYEARACGCVLLVSAVSGAKCQHMKNSLVRVPGDVASLQGHIDMLASDRAMFSHLRRNSLANVADLTWDKAVQSLVKAYCQCLDSRRRTCAYLNVN